MKKVDFKKTLVRNIVQPIPKASNEVQKNKKEVKRSDSKNVKLENCRLDKPELHSTLKMSKTIDKITNHKRTKSLSDTEKLAVDEQVTRKVNFPYEQHIYKDLIPLEIDQYKTPISLSSRGPLPQKDREPILSDFLESKPIPKYYCYPNFKVDSKFNNITSNNLRLYYIMEKH